MDYKIFEDIPELQKEVDEAYKELNQATVNNDREKIDEQLPKVCCFFTNTMVCLNNSSYLCSLKKKINTGTYNG